LPAKFWLGQADPSGDVPPSVVDRRDKNISIFPDASPLYQKRGSFRPGA
jgi:hypothetical protein